jgi:hypothetical protein
MKSSEEQLESRGFIKVGYENGFSGLSFKERIKLLKSDSPVERSLGARLLSNYKNTEAISELLKALTIEKKLYPKIEICNSLVSFGIAAVVPLTELIGKIGTNQHRKVPESRFKKDNYPLPRDIVSRTLIRIGSDALPHLSDMLDSKDTTLLSEVIDAIGFICFYETHPGIYLKLLECFNRFHNDDLIRWKIFRAMCAFPESESFLNDQKHKSVNQHVISEIDHSLRLIEKRIKKSNVDAGIL